MGCFRCNGQHLMKRPAFTLLEVIVGLTLMATVLVGSLLSFSAHQKQRRFADAKIVAVTIADDLLNLLSASPEGIPANGRGLIAGKSDWFWRTSVVGAMAPANVPMRRISSGVKRTSPEGGSPDGSSPKERRAPGGEPAGASAEIGPLPRLMCAGSPRS